MTAKCVHSCKGLCNALEIAEHREAETIKEYQSYAASCDYPDVREILETLIADRERALRVLAGEARDSHCEIQYDRSDQRQPCLI